ncbi:glycosyltransferase family 4 protein [Neisseriaceae bacterium JH1-16]|nr:glycosyltransferase family 4 protein [Neisseriaceae bacterium JH1-16]
MSNPPCILICSNTAWSIYNFRKALLETLQDNGYKIVVVAPRDNFSPLLAKLGCTCIDMAMSAKGMNPLEDAKLMIRLLRVYRAHAPDFIFHYTIKPNIYGSLAASIAGIPSIAITTGLGYAFLSSGLVSFIAKKLYKLALYFPKEVWFLNQDDRKEFVERKLTHSKKTFLLPGEGVDTRHFSPTGKPRPDEVFRFLLIARMLWDKGVGEYVEAARFIRRRHPDTVFQLLGALDAENPSVIGKSQMDAWQAEGIIEYLGTTKDVRPAIAQADCVVLPSYREGISRTLLEAAAMAKPIVATDVPGCKDVVIDTASGLLCKPRNAKALTSALEKMRLLSEQERASYGQAGRKLVEESFSDPLVIEHYLSALRRYRVTPV